MPLKITSTWILGPTVTVQPVAKPIQSSSSGMKVTCMSTRLTSLLIETIPTQREPVVITGKLRT